MVVGSSKALSPCSSSICSLPTQSKLGAGSYRIGRGWGGGNPKAGEVKASLMEVEGDSASFFRGSQAPVRASRLG